MNIEIKNLSFSYRKGKEIITKLSYTFTSGKAYLLQGANGSGKTTLSKLIASLLPLKKATIFIDDEDISNIKPEIIASKMGYLFQNPDMQLFGNTVWEELTFPYEITETLDEHIKEKIDIVLDKFGLKTLMDRLPLMLSGGEKQRLALATIFVRDVEFLLLDEPSSSIDESGKLFLAETVNNFVAKGGGVILITHDEELKALISGVTVLTMKGGTICEA